MVGIFNYIKTLRITWLSKLETENQKRKTNLFVFSLISSLTFICNYFSKRLIK